MTKAKPVPLTILEASLAAHAVEAARLELDFTTARKALDVAWTEFLAKRAKALVGSKVSGLKPRSKSPCYWGCGGYDYRPSVDDETTIAFTNTARTVEVDVKVTLTAREQKQWNAKVGEVTALRHASKGSPARVALNALLKRHPDLVEKITGMLNATIAKENAGARKSLKSAKR